MTKEEGKIKVDGLVIEALPGTQFRVRLDNGHEVLAYLAGKMRKHYIRILLGDHVSMEMSPYDMTRARITFRQRKNAPTSVSSQIFVSEFQEAPRENWGLFLCVKYEAQGVLGCWISFDGEVDPIFLRRANRGAMVDLF